MPSTTSTLLSHLSSKLSKLFHLRHRLLPKCKASPTNDLPIARSNLAFHRKCGRKLTQEETDVLYAQAHWDLEAAPALAADTTTATDSSEDEFWDSNERVFSIAVTDELPDTDLSAEDWEEDWREHWAPISIQLKEVAKKRVVVTTISGRQDEREEKNDFEYCDYDYGAALEAMKEPELEREEGCKDMASLDGVVKGGLDGSRAIFAGRVRKQLRQVALGDSDDEEDEEVMVYSRDMGSMKTMDGETACGDAWWKRL